MNSDIIKYLFEIMQNEKYIQVNMKKRREGNHVIVVSREGPGILFSLNYVASEILELCDGNNTIGEIVDYLVNKYQNVDVEKIREDVLYCIRNFEKIKLIKRCTNGNPH